MKTIGKVSIILAIVCITSFIIAFATGPIFLLEDLEKININQFENSSINGIDALEINLLSVDVEVYPILSNEFEFNLKGYCSKAQENNVPKLSVQTVGETVKLNIIYPQGINFGVQDLDLYIGIPENYKGKIEIGTASGDIEIENIKLEDFEAKTLSGEIKINSVKSLGSSLINSASGDFQINNLESKNLNAESLSGEMYFEYLVVLNDSYFQTSSGDISIENMDTGYSRFKTISGDILIENSMKINSVTTTSGDIDIKNFEIDNELNIESVSGSVELDFVEGSLIDLEFNSLSGDLDNYFGDIMGGKNKVYVKTTSGDLNVY